MDALATSNAIWGTAEAIGGEAVKMLGAPTLLPNAFGRDVVCHLGNLEHQLIIIQQCLLKRASIARPNGDETTPQCICGFLRYVRIAGQQPYDVMPRCELKGFIFQKVK